MKTVFEGECAKGFVLGALQNSLNNEVSVGALRERVLWQWGNKQAHFPALVRTVDSLGEEKLIEIVGSHPITEKTSVRLRKKT
jgi:hypothetical protein